MTNRRREARVKRDKLQGWEPGMPEDGIDWDAYSLKQGDFSIEDFIRPTASEVRALIGDVIGEERKKYESRIGTLENEVNVLKGKYEK